MDLPTVTAPRWSNAAETAVDCIIDLDGAELPFTAAQDDSEPLGRAVFAAAVAGRFGAIAAYVAPPAPVAQVPQSVSPRQLKLALLGAGLLDQIDAFVASASTPRAAKISWEYATEYRRDNPMLIQMAAQLDPPMPAEQIDQLFIAAAAIE